MPLEACSRYASRLDDCLTVGEILMLESLPEDVRRVIHKYAKVGGDVKLVAEDKSYTLFGGEDSGHSPEYVKGWRDAMDYADDEIGSISLSRTPPRRRR